jgi:hypothetical protein
MATREPWIKHPAQEPCSVLPPRESW